MAKQTKLVTGAKDHAWAIEILAMGPRQDGTPRYAGIYNWLTGLSQPRCLGGVTTALYETRREAREARKGLWGFGPRKAAVRKVRVELHTLPGRH